MTVSQPSQSDLAQLIKALKPKVRHFGPKKREDVDALAEMFDVRLPSDYRWFLGSYGALAIDEVRIIGLADETPEFEDLVAADVTLLLRLAHIDTPLDLLPVEDLGDGHWACVLCPPEGASQGEVVVLDLAHPLSTTELPHLSPSFISYVYYRLLMLVAPAEMPGSTTPSTGDIDHALDVFERHIVDYDKEFGYDHAKGGKLPRNHDWRPYRYCIQDVLFGATVVRHYREANCLEVDVFLTADVPEYGPLAGARALASFLLSEAYKCGGTMEIRFTRNVEGGRVPAELKKLAEEHGVQIGQGAAKGAISAHEARALYAALTGFSAELRERIDALDRAGKVKQARSCYVVHHGVWTREQVEMIVLGSELPDSILGGMAQPQQRHLYYHDLSHARAAVMAGMLDLVLARRERSEGGVDYDLEDDVLPLQVSFDGATYTRRYQCSEPIPVPWLYQTEEGHLIAEGVPFQVVVRARDAADMRLHMDADINLAGEMRARENHPTLVLVPADLTSLDSGILKQLVARAQTAQVGLLVCPEGISTLDRDAAQRLAQSRILRQ